MTQLTTVSSSAAGLKILVPSPTDGQHAVIRLGTEQDQNDIGLIYNKELGHWYGSEIEIVRSQDQLDAQCQSSPGYTVKQLLSTNTDNAIGGGDVLFHYASLWQLALGITAGMTLQYRQHCFILGAKTPFKKCNIGACLFAQEEGETRTREVAAAWAETAYLLGGREWPGSSPVYEWRKQGWTNLEKPGGGALEATSKKSLGAGVYGFMESGATSGGGFVSYSLLLRWAI